MPSKALFSALALLAALVFAGPALAVVNSPDGAPGAEGQPADKSGAKPGALPTGGQLQEAAKAAEARENAASKSVEDMLRKAQESTRTPSPAAGQGEQGGQRRSGRAIYGDIIIHR